MKCCQEVIVDYLDIVFPESFQIQLTKDTVTCSVNEVVFL